MNTLSESLNSSKKLLENYQLIKNGEVDNLELKKCRVQLKDKQNEIDNLKGKYKMASTAVNILNSKLLRKKKNVINKKSEMHKPVEVLEEEGNGTNSEEVMFGFISLNKNLDLVFIDVNSNKYKISDLNNREKIRKCIGMPVKVIKDSINTVTINYIYYNLNAGIKAKAINKDKDFKIRESKADAFIVPNEFEGKKILIIGSRNKYKFTRALSKTGADVIWHEGYEDSEQRIGDICPSCDVVVVCTSHVPHSVIDKIHSLDDYNQNIDKYQMIKVDNTINIVSRIRYIVEKTKKER